MRRCWYRYCPGSCTYAAPSGSRSWCGSWEQRSREVLTLLAGLVEPDAMARLEREIPSLDADSECWCGSGSPFRACRRGRDQEGRLRLEELRESVERTMRRHRRGCLHPMAGPECEETGASARSIQRAELRKIAEGTFSPSLRLFQSVSATGASSRDASVSATRQRSRDSAIVTMASCSPGWRQHRSLVPTSSCSCSHTEPCAWSCLRRNGR